jgi:hypothetical protein
VLNSFDPLLAFRQHVRQEADRRGRIVVDMGESAAAVIRLGRCECRPRGGQIVRRGMFLVARSSPKSREQRLPRNAGGEASS